MGFAWRTLSVSPGISFTLVLNSCSIFIESTRPSPRDSVCWMWDRMKARLPLTKARSDCTSLSWKICWHLSMQMASSAFSPPRPSCSRSCWHSIDRDASTHHPHRMVLCWGGRGRLRHLSFQSRILVGALQKTCLVVAMSSLILGKGFWRLRQFCAWHDRCRWFSTFLGRMDSVACTVSLTSLAMVFLLTLSKNLHEQR